MARFSFALLLALGLVACENAADDPIADPKKTSGRITMTVSADESRTITGDTVHTINEKINASLVFDLANAPIVDGGTIRQITWVGAEYSGSVNWLEIFSHAFLCNGTSVVEHDTSLYTFSSALDGPQPAAFQIEIADDNTYTIDITPSLIGTPSWYSHARWSACQNPGRSSETGPLEGVPFAHLFAKSNFTGTVSASNRINGSLQFTDTITVDQRKTPAVPIPVSVNVIWDFTMN